MDAGVGRGVPMMVWFLGVWEVAVVVCFVSDLIWGRGE